MKGDHGDEDDDDDMDGDEDADIVEDEDHGGGTSDAIVPDLILPAGALRAGWELRLRAR